MCVTKRPHNWTQALAFITKMAFKSARKYQKVSWRTKRFQHVSILFLFCSSLNELKLAIYASNGFVLCLLFCFHQFGPLGARMSPEVKDSMLPHGILDQRTLNWPNDHKDLSVHEEKNSHLLPLTTLWVPEIPVLGIPKSLTVDPILYDIATLMLTFSIWEIGNECKRDK